MDRLDPGYVSPAVFDQLEDAFNDFVRQQRLLVLGWTKGGLSRTNTATLVTSTCPRRLLPISIQRKDAQRRPTPSSPFLTACC
mmetsp:Transcript_13766/g.32776  ORF Transcript_13766/g.32776 Transcript_13766/m.32776 type:complete len:83 (+) Transcript_13766:71-319(+)